MKSIQISKAGDKSVFRIVAQECAQPAKNEVVIDVLYSGINFADLLMRQGLYPAAPSFPFTPGYEVSGVIAEVGSDVHGYKVGDAVLAGCYFGGYAEKIVVGEWQIVKLPFDKTNEQGMQQAAGVPVSFLTAYIALFEQVKIQSGEKLLIDCATGALGQMMIQLLKGKNISLYGMTSSQSKVSFLRELGVEPILGGFEQLKKEQKFHAIVNTRGGASIKKAQAHLFPLGRQVALGASDMVRPKKANLIQVLATWLKMRSLNSIDMMNANIGFFGLNVLSLFKSPKVLEKVLSQLDIAELESTIDRVFPFDEVGEAHEYIEGRQSKGKVLLKWN